MREGELKATNRKYMQVYIEQFDALEIYIAAGQDEKNLYSQDVRKVTNGERNFTMAPTQKFFLVVNGTNGAKYPQFNGKIVFRYYEYIPKCAQYTEWDGFECKP